MKQRRAFAVVALVILGASGAPAQVALDSQDREVARAGAERPPVGPERPFQLAPRLERTLPNGLRVIVTRQTSVPKVSITLTVLAGYASDPADVTGLAVMTADAIQEGTSTRTSREIRGQAFAMGGTISAAASQDYTSVTARGLAEFAPRLVDLVADVAMNPSFPEEEIAILKQQHLQAATRQNASPQFLSNKAFRQALFGAHPYARVAETPASIAAMDRAKVQAFHRERYRPNNAFVLIVGAVDPDAMFRAAEKAFASWARGDVAKPAFAAAPALTGRQVYFVQRPNSIQSSISMGNFTVKRRDPRWVELNLANTIFGGAFDSRIIRNIREEKGYSYSPGSQFTAFADAGFYRFAADVRNEVTGPTLVEVFKEIAALRGDGATAAEIDSAKQYLRGLFAIQTATQAGLSNVLNTVYVFGLPADYPETYRAKVAAVTPEQIKTAAATLLGSDNSVIVVVGDYPAVKEQLAQFGTITFVDAEGRKTTPP
jgi:zinc protease